MPALPDNFTLKIPFSLRLQSLIPALEARCHPTPTHSRADRPTPPRSHPYTLRPRVPLCSPLRYHYPPAHPTPTHSRRRASIRRRATDEDGVSLVSAGWRCLELRFSRLLRLLRFLDYLVSARIRATMMEQIKKYMYSMARPAPYQATGDVPTGHHKGDDRRRLEHNPNLKLYDLLHIKLRFTVSATCPDDTVNRSFRYVK